MITYREIQIEGKIVSILRNNKDSFPLNPDNTDYQEYLKWLAEGNTPEPADQTE